MTAKNYDLEERTAQFGEAMIKLAQKTPKTGITAPLINQMVRSGTSVGANYCEAGGAESRNDFEHKIRICAKEIKESKHWLRMLAMAAPTLQDDARVLWKEASELNLIFSAILRTSKANKIKQAMAPVEHSINL